MSCHPRPKFRPALESLEGRLCLSAAAPLPDAEPAPMGVSLLRIYPTAGGDVSPKGDLAQEQRSLPGTDFMLIIDGIAGESRMGDAGQHEVGHWMGLYHGPAGATQAVGAGGGKVAMQDIHFVAKSNPGDLDLTAGDGSGEGAGSAIAVGGYIRIKKLHSGGG
jgi:hypothetical protein